MPRSSKSDMHAALSGVFAEMEGKILKVFRDYVDTQFDEAIMRLKGAQMGEVAERRERQPKEPAAKPAKAAKKGKGGKRVPTGTVMEAALDALSSAGKPQKINYLRDVTGYSDQQLRRALSELARQNAVEKKGERRDRVYRATGKSATPPPPAGRPKKPSAPKKPSKSRKTKKSAKQRRKKTKK